MHSYASVHSFIIIIFLIEKMYERSNWGQGSLNYYRKIIKKTMKSKDQWSTGSVCLREREVSIPHTGIKIQGRHLYPSYNEWKNSDLWKSRFTLTQSEKIAKTFSAIKFIYHPRSCAAYISGNRDPMEEVQTQPHQKYLKEMPNASKNEHVSPQQKDLIRFQRHKSNPHNHIFSIKSTVYVLLS